ncbi:MAG: hypothetical protein KDA90_13490 [Planctomycetaceae bacterium]|nr:hypothetical protein [Planctomycetaceae bacterium]
MPARGRIPRPKHLFPDLAAIYFTLRRWGLRVERFFHEDAGWYPAWTIGAVSGAAGLMLAVLLFVWSDPAPVAVTEVTTPAPLVSEQPAEAEPVPASRSSLMVDVVRTRLPEAWDQLAVETIVSRPHLHEINLAALNLSDQWQATSLDRLSVPRFEPYFLRLHDLPVTPVLVTASNEVDAQRPVASGRLAGLEIEKVMSATASVGTPYTYWIFVRNVSGDVIPSVTVRERLSALHRISAVEPVAQVEADELVWRLNQLPPGDLRKLTVTLLPDQVTEVASETSLDATTAVGASAYVRQPSNSVPEPRPMPMPEPVSPGRPDLRLTVSEAGRLRQGDLLSLVFEVSNAGTAAAEDVVIKVDLSPEFQHRYGKSVQHQITRLEPGQTHRALLQAVATQVGAGQLSTLLTMRGDLQESAEVPVPIRPGSSDPEPSVSPPVSGPAEGKSLSTQVCQRFPESLPECEPLAPLASVRQSAPLMVSQ